MHQCTKVQSKAGQKGFHKVVIIVARLDRTCCWATGNPRSLGSDLFMHAPIFHALGSTKQISAHLNAFHNRVDKLIGGVVFRGVYGSAEQKTPGEEEEET